jgi:hypothetical protein
MDTRSQEALIGMRDVVVSGDLIKLLWDMATIHDKVGHLETLAIDLLYAHLDASFIFNHLETMNGGPNSSFAIAHAQKPVYNSFGLNHLRRYGPVCRESLPYP